MSNSGVSKDMSTMRRVVRMRLSELCQIRYGKDHKHLADGDIPVYGSGGIMRYAGQHLYDKKSVLIPRKGTLRNLMFVDTPFWSVDTMFYTVIDENKVIPEYLFYSMQLIDLEGMNVGTAVPSLTTALLNEIRIDIPSKKVQRAVVATISALDKKIEVNKRIIANLEEQARAIFKSWFVDFEPFQDGEFVESELGMIPAGWKVVEMRELFSFTKGKKPVPRDSECEKLPYLTLDAFEGGTPVQVSTLKVVTAQESDSLMVMDGARSGLVLTGRSGVISSTFALLKPFDPLFSEIIYQFVKFNELTIRSHTTGSAIPHTDKEYVLQLQIPLPVNVLEISNLFAKLRTQLISSQKQNRTLAQLRDTLLPKLMSGEIEVPCDE